MLADVNAVDPGGERQADAEGECPASGKHSFIMKDARRDERESGHAGGVTTRERAFGFRTAAWRPRWTWALEDQSRGAHGDPARNRSDGDRRSTSPAPESSRQDESGRDIVARKPEQLERPLRQLDASIVVPACPIICSAIEWGRLVERSDCAEGAQRRQRRCQGRCVYHTRTKPARGIHARAKLHDACYCQI